MPTNNWWDHTSLGKLQAQNVTHGPVGKILLSFHWVLSLYICVSTYQLLSYITIRLRIFHFLTFYSLFLQTSSSYTNLDTPDSAVVFTTNFIYWTIIDTSTLFNGLRPISNFHLTFSTEILICPKHLFSFFSSSKGSKTRTLWVYVYVCMCLLRNLGLWSLFYTIIIITIVKNIVN